MSWRPRRLRFQRLLMLVALLFLKDLTISTHQLLFWDTGHSTSFLFAEAQRLKIGCYDDNPTAFSCQEVVPVEKIPFDVEQVCWRIQEELIPRRIWEQRRLAQTAEALNRIDASSDFCKQVQQAFAHCILCLPTPQSIRECVNFEDQRCGGKATAEEIVESNDGIAQVFDSFEAIEETCAHAAKIFTWQFNSNQGFNNDTDVIPSQFPELFIYFPPTIDFCNRISLVQHLCPGRCEGTCFNNDTHKPTCDANDTVTMELFSSEPEDEIIGLCETIRFSYFRDMPLDQLMNTENHLDYLRAVPDESCTMVRQAYPHCIWCSKEKDLCFNSDNLPSCDPPPEVISSNSTTLTVTDGKSIVFIDYEEVCSALDYLILGAPHEDVYNVSKHKDLILFDRHTKLCEQARFAYHKCFWCIKEDVPVDFCQTSGCAFDEVDIPDDIVVATNEKYGLQSTVSPINPPDYGTCWVLEGQPAIQNRSLLPATRQQCFEDLYLARICPDFFCYKAEVALMGEINYNYLGTTNHAQRVALIWVSRASAILSFFGASFILFDVFSDRIRRKTVYHQLMLFVATFDMITSVAWVFSTAPIDSSPEDGGHVEGAVGNNATCKAQAFCVQLGFTSVFFNASLAIYYVLVIVYGWREFQLKQIRWYLYLPPLFVGLALAFGAIPVYHWVEYGCHVLTLPEGEWWAVAIFVVAPIGLSIVTITLAMIRVYCKVRDQAATARKWAFGHGNGEGTATGRTSGSSAMERAVFWQCFCYVLAFYISWPLLFCVYLASIDVNGPLWLCLIVAFLAPLQGFNNFLVYSRPKVSNWRQRRREEALKRREQERRHTHSTFPSTAEETFMSKIKNAVLGNGARHDAEPSEGSGEHDGIHEGAPSKIDADLSHDSDDEDFIDAETLRSMDPSAALPLQRDQTVRASERLAELERNRIAAIAEETPSAVMLMSSEHHRGPRIGEKVSGQVSAKDSSSLNGSRLSCSSAVPPAAALPISAVEELENEEASTKETPEEDFVNVNTSVG